MKRSLTSLSFCAALSASVSASRAADACSRSPCDTALPVPLSGGSNVAVPANAAVFGLFAGATVPAPSAGVVSLRRTDLDEVVPLSVVDARRTTGLFLLPLGAPLAAGSTYRFTTPTLCAQPGPGAPTNRTTGITVTPAAPLPTALGAVALAAPARRGAGAGLAAAWMLARARRRRPTRSRRET